MDFIDILITLAKIVIVFISVLLTVAYLVYAVHGLVQARPKLRMSSQPGRRSAPESA